MTTKDICLEIETDEFYSKFLVDNVKPIANMTVSEQVNKLLKGIEELNINLEQQVLLKHNDLLTQATHVTNLENALSSVQIHVNSLMNGATNLKQLVHVPYYTLLKQTMILERIQLSCHLLRHSSKIINLHKKLDELQDAPKQAIILHELTDLISDYNFEGIIMLEAIIKDIKYKKEDLLNSTTTILQKCLLNGDKLALLQCFKVFNNLQCTNKQIQFTVKDMLDDLRSATSKALNIQVIGDTKRTTTRITPGKANVMNPQQFKIILWENLETLFKDDYTKACLKIMMLQSVLNELHAIGDFRNIAKMFWNELFILFSSELEKASSTANQCVELDFPKLLKFFNDLLGQCKFKELAVKMEYLKKWENAFLSKSLGKLLEPVRSMWHLGQVPTIEQIDNAVRVIAATLSVSLGDKYLSIALASSVAKCIKQMNVESEQRFAMDSDVAQIIEAPTSSQQRNTDLCNILFYFSSQVKKVLLNMNANLPKESVQLVQNSLKNLSSLPILQLYANSINGSLQLILMTIHEESDLNKTEDPTGKELSCSLYMKELQQFISRCKEIYLSMFDDKEAVNTCCIGIATACIERFIQHVCNVNPLSNYGRSKLQVDCKYLEIALSPLVPDISSLGEYQRQLKALQLLLGKSAQEIVKSQAEGALLPHSIVMMYLFSFGSSQLVPPHVCAGWSIQKLMQWLDSHKTEKERIEFVAGALQRYQTYIRQNQIANYDDVYPLLLQLLEDARNKVM